MEQPLNDAELIDFLLEREDIRDEIEVSKERIAAYISPPQEDPRRPYCPNDPMGYYTNRGEKTLPSQLFKDIIENTGREFSLREFKLIFTRKNKTEN